MNASLQTTGIIQVFVWFGIFFLSLPLNLSWFCDASSYFSFVLRLSWRSCWPFVYWLSCDFHFLSLHHEMLVTGPSPPPNVQGDPVILVSLFSFFSFFSERQGYFFNQLYRSYPDLYFAMTCTSFSPVNILFRPITNCTKGFCSSFISLKYTDQHMKSLG